MGKLTTQNHYRSRDRSQLNGLLQICLSCNYMFIIYLISRNFKWVYENIVYAFRNRRQSIKFYLTLLRKQDNNVVVCKDQIKMGRIKQNQNIDDVIQSIASIAKSQCSLSDQDLNVLNEAIERLQFLKRKKGKTNKQIRKEVAVIIGLLAKFFVEDQNDEIKMPH
jgi:hypothetical protein